MRIESDGHSQGNPRLYELVEHAPKTGKSPTVWAWPELMDYLKIAGQPVAGPWPPHQEPRPDPDYESLPVAVPDPESGPGTRSGSGTATRSGSGTATRSGSGTGTQSDAGSGPGARSDAGSPPGTQAEAGSGPGTQPDAGSRPGSWSDAESGPAAQS